VRASRSLAVLVLSALPVVARQPAAETPLPPPDRTPRLVVRHPGPHAPVTGLAFAPDGTLYAGGFGKLVHRYTRAGGTFVPGDPLRVPVGPGNAGAVNAVAVSPDGKWVAVAGRAPVRGETWAAADDGVVVETRDFPPLLKRDYGVVYLFNTNPADAAGGKVIRGPEAGVRALAFATPGPAAGPVLVTAGVEWDDTGKQFGAVRVYDVATGKELAARTDLPETPTRPGLAAWVGGDAKALRVAVAWPPFDRQKPGDLLVWDVAAGRDLRFPDGIGNVALALRTDKAGATKELLSGGFVGRAGRFVPRPADLSAAGTPVPLTGDNDQFCFPLALTAVGDATAVLVQLAPPPAGTIGRAAELRLVGADGTTRGRVALKGVGAGSLPSLAASPDGRFVAVAGFADDRIEVYDAAALADGKAVVQTLAGAAGGFARAAFLAGNRLWLGGPADDAPRGGTVFDFATRKAAAGDAGGAGQKLDAPDGGPLATEYVEDKGAKTVTVTATVGGRERAFVLRENEIPTAAAYLPAAPAWDKALGPVVAIAHYHRTAAAALVTLFDADGRRLLQLGGPALRIDGLAFSGSRPLLAAVGADRTATVWSLRALAAPFAAIEGVTMVERDGALAVASVAPASPARKVLEPGDVVDAVGGAKGELKPVKSYRDFLLAVRAVPVGDTARVRVKGKAAVAVPVGRGVGHRHPLFELWIDPAANAAGGRDWIGWTPAGPYDANSPAAEARLGWLTATGRPVEPVVYAGADQYRRLYYKTNFLKFLTDAADFGQALEDYVAQNPRTPPVLTLRADGAEERDGARLLRAKPAGLDVRLDDPDGVLRLDDAVLRWRMVGRDGRPGNWQVVPLPTGEATLPLAGYVWSRGAHRFEVELHETADLPPAVKAAAAFQYVAPAPVVAVRVNGAAVAPGEAVTSPKDEIELAADVTAAPGEEVVVAVTTTGPGGEKPVPLPAGKDGRFGPVTVKLHPDAKTAIRLTARNAGAGDAAKFEADAFDLTVWHAPPVPKPVPRVRLSIVSPVDPPAAPGRPLVSDAAKVGLSAVIAAEGVTKIEWDDGDGTWAAGALPAAGAAATRDVTIAVGGKPRTLQVRVTAGGAARSDAITVVWAALPGADFAPFPGTLRGAALVARGPVRPVAGGGPYTATVVVDAADPTVPRRTFPVRGVEPDAWQSDVQLTPGDNTLGLVVGNEWKSVRVASREVRYARPPLVVAVEPIAARGADVGDVVAAVVSPAGLAPDRLTLDDRPLAARVVRGPVVVCGIGVWWMRAEAVALAPGGVLPKTVRVAARNADGDGDAATVAVAPKPVAPPPPPPPEIVVTAGRDRAVVAAGGTLNTDEPEFAFGVQVSSAAKLTAVEVRRLHAAAGQPDRVPGVAAGQAVAAGGGFALTAVPSLTLREGLNQFEVVASNGLTSAAFKFTVSYTPPPVRVVIDEIAEARPDGAFTPLARPPGGGAVAATTGFLRVRGRVVWTSATEAARGPGYDVVLFANDVRHLPVEVAAPPAGGTEAAFVSPLFLNAKDTAVRIEVARRRQSDPVPQQLAQAVVRIDCGNPHTKQRLHVLVVAPEEPDSRAGAMAREVIHALNGEFIGSPAGFTDGPFKHKAFVKATLYRPLVYNVGRANLVGQLHDVEAKIRQMAGGTGTAGWVNDVVVVYYQGRDLMGRDGVRRLHTTRSLAIPSPVAAEPHAVRIDELPPTSGVRFAVLNVVEKAKPGEPVQRVTTGPMLLRYAWQNRESLADLLDFYHTAIGANPTVGTVVDWVRGAVEQHKEKPEQPTASLTPTVRERPLGSGDRK